MPSAGFEPAIPEIDGPENSTINRKTAKIGIVL
jgi:hypothetical protein